MPTYVSVQITAVTRRVLARRTCERTLPAVHRRVTAHQRLAPEPAPAGPACVPRPLGVTSAHVVPQRGLVGEAQGAAFERLGARFVHGREVALEVVLTVGDIGAVGAVVGRLRALAEGRG